MLNINLCHTTHT